jgi:hypothetical protein
MGKVNRNYLCISIKDVQNFSKFSYWGHKIQTIWRISKMDRSSINVLKLFLGLILLADLTKEICGLRPLFFLNISYTDNSTNMKRILLNY